MTWWRRWMPGWSGIGRRPSLIAAHLDDNKKVDRTRPLCPFPQEARYKGTGDSNDAAQFHLRRTAGLPRPRQLTGKPMRGTSEALGSCLCVCCRRWRRQRCGQIRERPRRCRKLQRRWRARPSRPTPKSKAPTICPMAARSAPPRSASPFCRVIGVATPTADSHIGFEVWLPPASSWNGNFRGEGSGGSAGAISPGPMRDALLTGYATMSTDNGHVDGANGEHGLSWAYQASGKDDRLGVAGAASVHRRRQEGRAPLSTASRRRRTISSPARPAAITPSWKRRAFRPTMTAWSAARRRGNGPR